MFKLFAMHWPFDSFAAMVTTEHAIMLKTDQNFCFLTNFLFIKLCADVNYKTDI